MGATLNSSSSSGSWSTSGLLKSLLGLDHGLDTVVHILHEIDLRSSESSLVGDVENSIVSFGMFTMNTSDLNIILVSDGIELSLVLSQKRKLDMDRGSQGSTKVGWAGGDVSEMVVVGKLGNLLDGGCGLGKSGEDGKDVGTFLHGDDSQLILLVNPDEESLVFVVENTSS